MFDAVKFFIENLEVKPEISIDSRSEIKFPKRGSSYWIGTAGQRAFGRGDTLHRVHCSEAAFYQNFERIFGGVSEACEYGEINIETTPNGRGEIYDLWQKAKSGKSSYTPIFIPWFIDQEYSADNLTEEEKKGLSKPIQEMFAVPDDEFMAGITADEKNLIERVAKEWGITLTAGQLKWRRYKIWDKGELFFQEYPEDDVSCFLQSGRSVFSKITTDITKRIPLDNFENWKADDKIKAALKKRLLYGGVDGAEGIPGGDAHCFAVIDSPSDEDKAIVIYEYTSNEPIDVFWSKIKKVLDNFNIYLGVESNGLGVAHVRHARSLGIGFVEWQTGVNRPAMIAELEEAYRKGILIETYPEAENEARDMVYTTERAEHLPGKHDDRVFARAIAWGMRKKLQPGLIFI